MEILQDFSKQNSRKRDHDLNQRLITKGESWEVKSQIEEHKACGSNGRLIINNTRMGNSKWHGLSNKIDNRKYNIFTLLPMFIFHEYKYFSNLYFLLIALIQFYKPLKVGFTITYVGPIAIVFSLSFVKEVVDELHKYFKDKSLNNEVFEKCSSEGPQLVRSAGIRVGDIIKVKPNQRVPADIILLKTGTSDGSVFLRTDQLDGETD